MDVFHADALTFPLPPGHRFPAAKYRLLREKLLADGIVSPAELLPAPLASREDVLRAHAPAYVDAVLAGRLDPRIERRIGLPMSPELVRRSLASVGGTLAAARSALRDGIAGNLGGGTHHGLRDEGEGYCVFNDVAVAILALLAEGRIARAAVVDLDVHQGDGNGEILGRHPAVHILCMHGEKNFPWRKIPAGHDVPLPDGTGDADYLARLDRELPRVLAFAPDLLFFIAGADPLAEDALGRLSLTRAGLAARDRRVFQACRDARVPVAIVLGGGYANPIDLSVAVHANTYRAAREVFGAPPP